MKHLVISSMPRSGSTMLSEMMGLHPAILGLTEIFHHDEEQRKKCHAVAIGDGGAFAYEGGAYGRPELYLDYLEAAGRLKGKSVLAYKVMESQCPAIYNVLPHRRAHIVHIRRNNIVALAASWKLAEQTGKWHFKTEEQREAMPPAKVTVTMEEVRDWSMREEAQLDLVLRTRLRVWYLYYHEIAKDPSRIANFLFDLIEVASFEAAPTQVKGGVRPLSEVIENYDELKSKLGAMAWMLESGMEVM